ncbi:MAG: hypothetical protein GC153_12645 [Alphaproteobacteria bacterium]|nr:hypothetical protein [Alphaproteobacteria bacterium]
MLIKNYGLFWKKSDVFWGRQRNPGHLKGIRATSLTTAPVDFREQQGIYVLYDESFQLVYVGQAGSQQSQRLFKRIKQHTRDQLADRWTRFSWFGIRAVNQTGALRAEARAAHPSIVNILDHVEAILIATAEPRHNRQGGRFGDNVEQYLQYRDEDNLGLESNEMIREIWLQSQAPMED